MGDEGKYFVLDKYQDGKLWDALLPLVDNL